MPRILLVNLPISVNSPRTAFPPLALLVLGGALKALRESGLEFEYELLDLDLRLKQGRLQDEAGFFAQGAEWVSARRPDLCFFSTHGINQQLILPLAEALKALRPTCRMVLGGVGATLQAAELIRNFPQLDLVIKGEGEPALPALVAALLEGRDFSAVPGAVYRQGGGCVENPRPPALAAEEIPTPDYTLLQLEEYAAHNRKHPYIVPGFGLIESGRGCGWNCAFCAPAKMWNRRARYRPIPALVREMRLLAGHGLGFSFFTQDNLDPSFLREFSAVPSKGSCRPGR